MGRSRRWPRATAPCRSRFAARTSWKTWAIRSTEWLASSTNPTRTWNRHASIGLMTPHDVHHGLARAKWDRRAKALLAKYAAHPERFPNGVPTPPPLPTAAWINKPVSAAALAEPADQSAPAGAQVGGAVAEVAIVNAAVTPNTAL